AARHPMLGAGNSNTGIYEINLDTAQSWLRDHQFGGSAVVPAVAYLELARAAVTTSGLPFAGLRDVRFERPLRAGAGTPRVMLRQGAFEVVGADGVVHARGRIATEVEAPPSVDLAALAPGAAQSFSHEEIYTRFTRLGFDYGPSFRVIRSLRARPADVV